MEKCYLFGAGINCYGVVKFVGKEKIIAIVDNNESKIGFEIEGIRIIGFKDFLQKYANELVIISAYYARNEIKRQLQENDITNYVVAPCVQKGYYESYQDMIADFHIEQLEALYIYGENFFSSNLIEALGNIKKEHIVKGFIRDSKFRKNKFLGIPVVTLSDVPEGGNILLATEEIAVEDRTILVQKCDELNIFNMYEVRTKNHQELFRFKNIHEAKRCFIIGNGPSLRIEDLEKLERNQEICFGSNWIIKSFEQTCWRPDYYVVMDYNFMRLMPNSIKNKNGNNVIIFRADAFENGLNTKEDAFTYTYQSFVYNAEQLSFSEDITKGVYGARTVTYDMIQIAAYMGFKEIYLLGVDCSNGSNHFYDANTIDSNKLENQNVLDANGWDSQYSAWIKGYQKAEEYSRKNNFRIYNATRGGALEVFERVDFDELFMN